MGDLLFNNNINIKYESNNLLNITSESFNTNNYTDNNSNLFSISENFESCWILFARDSNSSYFSCPMTLFIFIL